VSNETKMKFEITFNKRPTYKCKGPNGKELDLCLDTIFLAWLDRDGKNITSWSWRGYDCKEKCEKKLKQIKAVCQDFIVVNNEVLA